MKIVEEYVKEKQKQENENKKKNSKVQKNDESLKQQENQCDEEGAYIWEDDYNDIHNWQRGGSASMKGISYHFDACILGEVFQR
ncbi:MAG: hypothetical protein EZS28_019615 [Streblomastix strix]|uniref:Uncharacterized protein n=1 Tax=Streblomastix strix TaxID=222440 RepID=A0A5J4VQZ6_9EUKA|nr:MAG: hypothetical protein EZS28_019615 [Streblomastix strix]